MLVINIYIYIYIHCILRHQVVIYTCLGQDGEHNLGDDPWNGRKSLSSYRVLSSASWARHRNNSEKTRMSSLKDFEKETICGFKHVYIYIYIYIYMHTHKEYTHTYICFTHICIHIYIQSIYIEIYM